MCLHCLAGGAESRAGAVTEAAGDAYRFGKTPSSAGSHTPPPLLPHHHKVPIYFRLYGTQSFHEQSQLVHAVYRKQLLAFLQCSLQRSNSLDKLTAHTPVRYDTGR